MHGKGVEYLQRNLDSIFSQTHKDFEVIVSDHSITDDIMDLCLAYLPDDWRLSYIRNTNKRGNSSANLNYGISFTCGQIIKPMFQDDYFFSNEALAVIEKRISDGEKWVVVGNNSFVDGKGYFNDFTPYWNDDMVFGVNTLSSPSCMAYTPCKEIWDERLIWLMDCEFYYRLFLKYGLPYLESRILVTNFGHDKQLTHLIPKERKQWEVDLIKKEYGR